MDGVLKAGGPGAAGHHVADGGGHVVSGFSALGSLGCGVRLGWIGNGRGRGRDSSGGGCGV